MMILLLALNIYNYPLIKCVQRCKKFIYHLKKNLLFNMNLYLKPQGKERVAAAFKIVHHQIILSPCNASGTLRFQV